MWNWGPAYGPLMVLYLTLSLFGHRSHRAVTHSTRAQGQIITPACACCRWGPSKAAHPLVMTHLHLPSLGLIFHLGAQMGRRTTGIISGCLSPPMEIPRSGVRARRALCIRQWQNSFTGPEKPPVFMVWQAWHWPVQCCPPSAFSIVATLSVLARRTRLSTAQRIVAEGRAWHIGWNPLEQILVFVSLPVDFSQPSLAR